VSHKQLRCDWQVQTEDLLNFFDIEKTAVTGYHLYGTQAGEDDEERMGLLVAD